MTAKINYAWDTSVFLAWVQDEPTAPLDDIALVVEEIDQDRANLIVSVEIRRRTVTPIWNRRRTAAGQR